MFCFGLYCKVHVFILGVLSKRVIRNAVPLVQIKFPTASDDCRQQIFKQHIPVKKT